MPKFIAGQTEAESRIKLQEQLVFGTACAKMPRRGGSSPPVAKHKKKTQTKKNDQQRTKFTAGEEVFENGEVKESAASKAERRVRETANPDSIQALLNDALETLAGVFQDRQISGRDRNLLGRLQVLDSSIYRHLAIMCQFSQKFNFDLKGLGDRLIITQDRKKFTLGWKNPTGENSEIEDICEILGHIAEDEVMDENPTKDLSIRAGLAIKYIKKLISLLENTYVIPVKEIEYPDEPIFPTVEEDEECYDVCHNAFLNDIKALGLKPRDYVGQLDRRPEDVKLDVEMKMLSKPMFLENEFYQDMDQIVVKEVEERLIELKIKMDHYQKKSEMELEKVKKIETELRGLLREQITATKNGIETMENILELKTESERQTAFDNVVKEILRNVNDAIERNGERENVIRAGKEELEKREKRCDVAAMEGENEAPRDKVAKLRDLAEELQEGKEKVKLGFWVKLKNFDENEKSDDVTETAATFNVEKIDGKVIVGINSSQPMTDYQDEVSRYIFNEYYKAVEATLESHVLTDTENRFVYVQAAREVGNLKLVEDELEDEANLIPELPTQLEIDNLREKIEENERNQKGEKRKGEEPNLKPEDPEAEILPEKLSKKELIIKRSERVNIAERVKKCKDAMIEIDRKIIEKDRELERVCKQVEEARENEKELSKRTQSSAKERNEAAAARGAKISEYNRKLTEWMEICKERDFCAAEALDNFEEIIHGLTLQLTLLKGYDESAQSVESIEELSKIEERIKEAYEDLTINEEVNKNIEAIALVEGKCASKIPIVFDIVRIQVRINKHWQMVKTLSLKILQRIVNRVEGIKTPVDSATSSSREDEVSLSAEKTAAQYEELINLHCRKLELMSGKNTATNETGAERVPGETMTTEKMSKLLQSCEKDDIEQVLAEALSEINQTRSFNAQAKLIEDWSAEWFIHNPKKPMDRITWHIKREGNSQFFEDQKAEYISNLDSIPFRPNPENYNTAKEELDKVSNFRNEDTDTHILYMNEMEEEKKDLTDLEWKDKLHKNHSLRFLNDKDMLKIETVVQRVQAAEMANAALANSAMKQFQKYVERPFQETSNSCTLHCSPGDRSCNSTRRIPGETEKRCTKEWSTIASQDANMQLMYKNLEQFISFEGNYVVIEQKCQVVSDGKVFQVVQVKKPHTELTKNNVMTAMNSLNTQAMFPNMVTRSNKTGMVQCRYGVEDDRCHERVISTYRAGLLVVEAALLKIFYIVLNAMMPLGAGDQKTSCPRYNTYNMCRNCSRFFSNPLSLALHIIFQEGQLKYEERNDHDHSTCTPKSVCVCRLWNAGPEEPWSYADRRMVNWSIISQYSIPTMKISELVNIMTLCNQMGMFTYLPGSKMMKELGLFVPSRWSFTNVFSDLYQRAVTRQDTSESVEISNSARLANYSNNYIDSYGNVIELLPNDLFYRFIESTQNKVPVETKVFSVSNDGVKRMNADVNSVVDRTDPEVRAAGKFINMKEEVILKNHLTLCESTGKNQDFQSEEYQRTIAVTKLTLSNFYKASCPKGKFLPATATRKQSDFVKGAVETPLSIIKDASAEMKKKAMLVDFNIHPVTEQPIVQGITLRMNVPALKVDPDIKEWTDSQIKKIRKIESSGWEVEVDQKGFSRAKPKEFTAEPGKKGAKVKQVHTVEKAPVTIADPNLVKEKMKQVNAENEQARIRSWLCETCARMPKRMPEHKNGCFDSLKSGKKRNSVLKEIREKCSKARRLREEAEKVAKENTENEELTETTTDEVLNRDTNFGKHPEPDHKSDPVSVVDSGEDDHETGKGDVFDGRSMKKPSNAKNEKGEEKVKQPMEEDETTSITTQSRASDNVNLKKTCKKSRKADENKEVKNVE